MNHSRFLPEALNYVCIKAGLLALPIFIRLLMARFATQWPVNKNFLRYADPELQLREQPPILTRFPFNPDGKSGTAIRMQT